VEGRELLTRLRRQRDRPDALLLHPFQGPGEVGYPRNRTMLQRSGRRLERGGRDARSPVLRQYDAVRPERVRAADQGAEILRIGDAVEDEEQRRAAEAGEQIVQLCIT